MSKLNILNNEFAYPVTIYSVTERELLVYENESDLKFSTFNNYIDITKETLIYDKNGKLIDKNFALEEKSALFGLSKKMVKVISFSYHQPETIDAENFRKILVDFLKKQTNPPANHRKVGFEGLDSASSLDEIIERTADYAVAEF